MNLQILADENIPLAREAFSRLGEVRRFQGRNLTPDQARDADILLVRSVTPVNAALLENSRIRFVGTATIGFDHIDRDYLARRGIGFASAPGSNAESASEYVLSALLAMAERRGVWLDQWTIGIIGCGNVGSRVKRKLKALGVSCLVNDPPLQESGAVDEFASLAEVLQADVVTLHVPLEKQGRHPTYQLANAEFFAALRPDAIFINTSRGAVVDEAALKAKLAQCPGFSAVLDVWRNEPNIDWDLVARAELATPHIAGYSLDGKARGTQMIYDAACAHLGIKAEWKMEKHLPQPTVQAMRIDQRADPREAIRKAVLACYDMRADDAALRRAMNAPDRAAAFDALRKNYPPRREFSATEMFVLPNRLVKPLGGLDFRIVLD